MKKLISCMVLTMAVLANVSAYASTTYDTTDNSVSTDANGSYKNVLISKGAELPTVAADIVYVDQAASGSTIGAAAKFLLKDNPADGAYTIRFGDGTKIANTHTFYIGVGENTEINAKMDPIEGDAGMVTNDGGKTYNLGFRGTANLENCRSIIVETTKGTLGYNLGTELSGAGAAEVGIQINGVPADKKESITAVYFSTTTIE